MYCKWQSQKFPAALNVGGGRYLIFAVKASLPFTQSEPVAGIRALFVLFKAGVSTTESFLGETVKVSRFFFLNPSLEWSINTDVRTQHPQRRTTRG